MKEAPVKIKGTEVDGKSNRKHQRLQRSCSSAAQQFALNTRTLRGQKEEKGSKKAMIQSNI